MSDVVRYRSSARTSGTSIGLPVRRGRAYKCLRPARSKGCGPPLRDAPRHTGFADPCVFSLNSRIAKRSYGNHAPYNARQRSKDSSSRSRVSEVTAETSRRKSSRSLRSRKLYRQSGSRGGMFSYAGQSRGCGRLYDLHASRWPRYPARPRRHHRACRSSSVRIPPGCLHARSFGPTARRISAMSASTVAPDFAEAGGSLHEIGTRPNRDFGRRRSFSASVSKQRCFDDDLDDCAAVMADAGYEPEDVRFLDQSRSSPPSSAPIWMTMSISWAPAFRAMASTVSATFAAVLDAPSGNPATVQTFHRRDPS